MHLLGYRRRRFAVDAETVTLASSTRGQVQRAYGFKPKSQRKEGPRPTTLFMRCCLLTTLSQCSL